jgi:hypothetical protein
MIDEFINLLGAALPSIEPYKVHAAVDAIKSFAKNNRINLIESPKKIDLIQGDIIGPVKTFFLDEEGNLFSKEFPVVVLTNTCDIENDENLILSVCYSENDFYENFNHIKRGDIASNTIGNFFYIYKDAGDSYVCDLSDCTTYSKLLVQNLLETGKINRYGTLTQVGWYILILKLTYHFFRPEDVETHTERSIA